MSTPKGVKVKTTDGWQDLAIVGPQGPPSGSMQLIEHKLLTAATPIIDFQNIPQTFQHLRLIGTVAQDAGARGLGIRFNGDATAAAYSNSNLVLTGTAAPVTEQPAAYNQGRYGVQYITGAGGGYSFEISLPSYRSTAWYRRFLAWGLSWNGTGWEHRNHYGAWGGFAINRITLNIDGTGNYVAGSEVSLYGIKAEPEGIRQNWNSSALRLYFCAVNSFAAQTWGKLKLSGPTQSLIDPPTDFVVNVDDSITVVNAGWYDLALSVSNADAASVTIYATLSTSATAGDGDIANGQSTGTFCRASCSGHVYLNAGQKVYAYAVSSAVTSTIKIHDFSISRAGAGPAGPPGAVGIDPELFKVDRRRGNGAGGGPNFTSAAPYEVQGATQGDLRFSITPSRNCWWEVKYRNILQCLDAAWYRCDARILLDLGATPTDATGTGFGVNRIFTQHNALVWLGWEMSALFKLEAGKSYTARCVFFPQSGTWQMYNESTYCFQEAKVVGFW